MCPGLSDNNNNNNKNDNSYCLENRILCPRLSKAAVFRRDVTCERTYFTFSWRQLLGYHLCYEVEIYPDKHLKVASGSYPREILRVKMYVNV